MIRIVRRVCQASFRAHPNSGDIDLSLVAETVTRVDEQSHHTHIPDPRSSQLSIDSCQTISLAQVLRVPASAARFLSDHTIFRLHSRLSPGVVIQDYRYFMVANESTDDLAQ